MLPRTIFLFLILSAVLTPSAVAQDQQSQAAKPGTISGRVIDEKGQPIYEAVVTIRGYGSGIRQETTSDRDGAFEFNGLSQVVYQISAGTPGYTSPARDPDSTQATSYRVGDKVTLVLIKGGVITGKVVTDLGEPVVGVSVRAQLIRDSNGQQPRYGAPMYERPTDDRGVYRIYGLATGTYVVMAGGGNSSVSYRNDARTYSPSSTRDTAAEITVQAGQETSNIDIRYRSEQGHTVSGIATGLSETEQLYFFVTLSSSLDGVTQFSESVTQAPGGTGFRFLGIPDGEYDVSAQAILRSGERAVSAPKRIRVRGTDVTGIEILAKPLASISGRVVLENSNAPECNGKRRAVITETLISAWHNPNHAAKDQPQYIWSFGGPVYPNDKGDIVLRNLAAGQYQIIGRLFAKYWYLRSISLPTVGATGPQSTRVTDVVSNWATLKSGDRLSGLTVTLTEGAASLQGQVKLNEGETVPDRLYVYLVPVEREKELDALRFFAAPVSPNRTIALNHIPPGRYWILAKPALEGPQPPLTRLRLPDEKELRLKLRRDAEQVNIEVELKPCQNVTDYELPLSAFLGSQRANQ